MPTTLSNTPLIFVGKCENLLQCKKLQPICDIYFQNFNETLTYDVVYFEQLGPGLWSIQKHTIMTPFWDGYPRANSAEPDQRVFTVCNLVCIFMEPCFVVKSFYWNFRVITTHFYFVQKFRKLWYDLMEKY